MEAIRCENLGRSYGSVRALKSLNLSIAAGSIFGFLGRNGAGKTTTIRLLTGLANPTTGAAWICGVETTRGDDSAREKFGYLPEVPAFYSWMTPLEFLDLVGQLFGLERMERRQRAIELLELSGLQDVGMRRIGGFSRGMRQRLGVAQAIIHRPPVLFLDEPTSALDPAGRRDVLDLIGRLRGETTVFLSSHILADVERVCDTIGVIHEGDLLLVAGRDELLDRYASDTVVIEVDAADGPIADAFVRRLEEMPWVYGLTTGKRDLRFSIRDKREAQRALIPLIAEFGLPITRYEWLRPTLEEIFLSLST